MARAKGRGTTIEIDGLSFPLGDTEWPVPVLNVLCGGTFELAERRACRRLLSPGQKVTEFGTAIGLVSMVAARIVGDAAATTFEADPALVRIARRSARTNNLAVDMRHAAVVASHVRRASFYRSRTFVGSSTLSLEDAEEISVPAMCARALCRELEPEVLIVDVEGGETALAEAIASSGARLLIVEFHPIPLTLVGCARAGQTLVAGGYRVVEDLCDGQVICFERGTGGAFVDSIAYAMLSGLTNGAIDERLGATTAARQRLPTSPSIRQRLARLLLQAGRPEEARLEAEALSEIAEDHFEGPLLHARACRRVGRIEEAIAAVDRAFDIGPDITEVGLEASDVRAAAGDWAHALVLVTRTLARNPYAGAGWLRRARLELLLGRTGDAQASAAESLRLDPANVATAELMLRLATGGPARVRAGKPPAAPSAEDAGAIPFPFGPGQSFAASSGEAGIMLRHANRHCRAIPRGFTLHANPPYEPPASLQVRGLDARGRRVLRGALAADRRSPGIVVRVALRADGESPPLGQTFDLSAGGRADIDIALAPDAETLSVDVSIALAEGVTTVSSAGVVVERLRLE